MNNISRQGYIGIFMGVLAGTFTATLLRLAQTNGMPSIGIAAGRLLIASLVLLPFAVARARADVRALARRDWLLIGGAGVLMAAHFATFISALEYSSILQTLVFSATTPFFAAFIIWFTLGDRPPVGVWIGIVLALVGTLVVAVGSGEGAAPPTRNAPLLGGTLAFGAALFISIYFAIGQQVRDKLDAVTYSTMVFGAAGVWLTLAMAVFGISFFGYPPRAYLWTLVVAFVGQLIGHGGWNLALGGFSATIVSLGLLLVPVTATVFAVV
ncbi:MAG: DMT family transporter, partial [Chloroflexota bacterium]